MTETTSERLDPPPKRWAEFWLTLERIGVWRWAPRYEGSATDVYCCATLEYNGRRVETVGMNSGFPPNWKKFATAVATLAGREF